MEQFIENIVLHTIIAIISIICYVGLWEPNLKVDSRWKKILFRVGGVAGTLWIISKTWFMFFSIPPLITAVAFIFLVWLVGVLLFFFIKWLFVISDAEIDKFLTWFFK